MTLICVRCRRPMSAAFSTVGEYAYGPKCAKIAGVLPNVSHAPRAPMAQPEVDARQLALDLASEHKPARQGHKYSFFGVEVLAMESGEHVKVREVQTDALWLGASMVAHADHLKPMPMKYFHGEVPQ